MAKTGCLRGDDRKITGGQKGKTEKQKQEYVYETNYYL